MACSAENLPSCRGSHSDAFMPRKTAIALSSRRRGEAGGSLTPGVAGEGGAASTKSRRSGTAGWAGRSERSRKVYPRNRLRYAS